MIFKSSINGYSSNYDNYFIVDEEYDPWKQIRVNQIITKDTTKCTKLYVLAQIYDLQVSQTSVSDKCLESAENQLSFGEIKYNVPVKDDESSSYVLLNLVFGERGNIQSANQRKSFVF